MRMHIHMSTTSDHELMSDGYRSVLRMLQLRTAVAATAAGRLYIYICIAIAYIGCNYASLKGPGHSPGGLGLTCQPKPCTC